MDSATLEGNRSQPRSAATRERLLDAAVEAFAEAGYPGTGLADIVLRAHQTTGAVYYHFASKEGLALAVVDRGLGKLVAEVRRCLNGSAGLESVIGMTFTVFRLAQSDKAMRVANHLNHAFGYLHGGSRRVFEGHVRVFIRHVAAAIRDTDLRGDVNAEQFANLVWMALQGSCQLAGIAMCRGTDAERLALSWRVILRSSVAPESVASLEEYLDSVLRDLVLQ